MECYALGCLRVQTQGRGGLIAVGVRASIVTVRMQRVRSVSTIKRNCGWSTNTHVADLASESKEGDPRYYGQKVSFHGAIYYDKQL
jgi:hypothetical protein